ncbi:MAG TPA: short-chain dehydrogenase, partial [Dehalococcoidia bacterium]|nr:short-chain dehydrogenase [Dehalococcoidia bacterium]
MGRLDDRVALVTGAGRYRGIGRAIVLRLAEEGANVVVTARARDASTFAAHEKEMGWKGIESVAEEVRATGRRALALNCDVTDKNELKRTVDSAIAEFGKIDVLVNNAALPSEAGAAPILEMTDENWYETVDVNLHGLYHTIRAVGREMVKGGGGSIVNISSTAGRIGIPNYGAYCATKWAMHGLT